MLGRENISIPSQSQWALIHFLDKVEITNIEIGRVCKNMINEQIMVLQ